MPNYLEIICLKCQNSKKVQKRENTKIGGKLGASCFKLVSLQSMYPIIDNILSYNLVEHCLSPFLLKRSKKYLYKRSHYVRGSKSREPTKDTV
jgi:hypothetical protein